MHGIPRLGELELHEVADVGVVVGDEHAGSVSHLHVLPSVPGHAVSSIYGVLGLSSRTHVRVRAGAKTGGYAVGPGTCSVSSPPADGGGAPGSVPFRSVLVLVLQPD